MSRLTFLRQQIRRAHTNSHTFCVNHVKKYDRENYLAASYIQDPSIRRAVFALRAFNVELSLVKDSTTNVDRAKLRFHFWSKLVEEINRRNVDRDTENTDKLNAYYNYTPIAKELLDLFYLVELDCDKLKNLNDLIGARVSSKILGFKPFNTITELELYCSKSNSSFYRLATNIAMKIKNVNDTDLEAQVAVVSEKLGIAQGLSIIIRGLLYNSSKDCCYVPRDLMEYHKLSSRDFIRKGLETEKIAPVIREIASNSQKLLDEISPTRLPKYIQEIFLPRVAIQAYLNKLRKCGYNLSDSRLSQRNEMLPLRLWLSSRFAFRN